MLNRFFAYGLIVLTLFVSCNNDSNSEKELDNKNVKTQEESLIVANKYLVKAEKTDIENYIRRHKLSNSSTW